MLPYNPKPHQGGPKELELTPMELIDRIAALFYHRARMAGEGASPSLSLLRRATCTATMAVALTALAPPTGIPVILVISTDVANAEP